jgi:bacterioferritin-associated ferredoxin
VLVCHCRAVTDRQIDAAVSAGADSTRAVVRATHAGTGCGGCLRSLRTIIEDALRPDDRLAVASSSAGRLAG